MPSAKWLFFCIIVKFIVQELNFLKNFPFFGGALVSLAKGNLRESREKLNHIYRDIDDAFRRRFEKRVLIGLPSLIARKNLLDLNLKNVSLDDSVDLEEIAKLLDAYSGKESARIIILF